MGIRTTVTLDEDVLERVKHESRTRGASFRDTLNDLLRTALIRADERPQRNGFEVKPSHMGYRAGLDHDDVESLLEYGEGENHR